MTKTKPADKEREELINIHKLAFMSKATECVLVCDLCSTTIKDCGEDEVATKAHKQGWIALISKVLCNKCSAKTKYS